MSSVLLAAVFQVIAPRLVRVLHAHVAKRADKLARRRLSAVRGVAPFIKLSFQDSKTGLGALHIVSLLVALLQQMAGDSGDFDILRAAGARHEKGALLHVVHIEVILGPRGVRLAAEQALSVVFVRRILSFRLSIGISMSMSVVRTVTLLGGVLR